MKLRLLVGLCALVAVGLLPATAGADPSSGPPICKTAGKALHGFHRGNLVVWGDAYVPSGKTLRVRGNLKLRPGACLDAFTLGVVHVRGNIRVQRGALLGLGCTPTAIGPGPPCNGMSTNDTVRGNIIAKNPLTMYLDGNTVWGDVISQGGGPGLHGDFLNFVFKDNWVGGDLIVRGWRGGWAGAIRNTVGGDLVWTKNKSAVDPDSNEVQTNVVAGDLRCFGNSVPAQVNAADGGQPNIVGGDKLGQCAGL